MPRPLKLRLRLRIEVCNTYKKFESLIYLNKKLKLDK